MDDELLSAFAAFAVSDTDKTKKPRKKPVGDDFGRGAVASASSGRFKAKYERPVLGTVAYIVNPITGREIQVDGGVYKKLIRNGHYTDAQLRALRTFYKTPPGKAGEDVTYSKKEIQELARQFDFWKESGGGWGRVKPQTKTERQKVLAKCGKKCFLRPDTLNFPVCRKCAADGKCDCKADCRGILGARTRARQWKYHDIAAAAEELGKAGGCEWAADDYDD